VAGHEHLGAALVAVVDYRLLLATMTVVIVIAAAYLAGEPRARKAQKRRHAARE
jgi:hypothetical protein